MESFHFGVCVVCHCGRNVIMNLFLSDVWRRLYGKDKVRALFVILQNPIFTAQSSYTVLAHVLRHITSLPNTDHQILVHWFRTLE